MLVFNLALFLDKAQNINLSTSAKLIFRFLPTATLTYKKLPKVLQ